MKPIVSNTNIHQVAQVIDIEEEKKIQKEVEALIELHDFIKAHPDSPVKEIARFMPPVDSRVVSKAIQALAIRDQNLTAEDKEKSKAEADSIEAKHQKFSWKVKV